MQIQNKKYNKNGFTLIEALLYLAVFGLVITAMVSTSATLMASSGQSSTEAMLAEEGDYLVSKITYAQQTQSGATFDSGQQNDGIYMGNNSEHEVRLNNSNTSVQNFSINTQGVFFTLSARTPSGRLLSQDFFATTSARY